jgi:methionyl-tRNA formyltransferase
VTPAREVISQQDPTRVVFFGSGEFAIPTLDALLARPDVHVVAVVSTPDRPAGRSGRLRPTPVSEHARHLGLPLLQPSRLRTPEAIAAIAALQVDLGVLADYGRVVPPGILELPPLGILNVHPSLLPRHRGATPVAATILAGDPQAGVTVMAMDEGLDTGPLLASRSWSLADDVTAPELEAEAARVGAELLIEVLSSWVAGRLPATPQAEDAATLTRPLVRDDGRLDPSRSARELERMVRALRPWPGTFIELDGSRLIVLAASLAPSGPTDRPGRIVAEGRGIALATTDGRLVLDEVQPSSGQPMSGEAFRRGRGRHLIGGEDA